MYSDDDLAGRFMYNLIPLCTQTMILLVVLCTVLSHYVVKR